MDEKQSLHGTGTTVVPANSYQLPPFLKASSFERYLSNPATLFGYFDTNISSAEDRYVGGHRWPYLDETESHHDEAPLLSPIHPRLSAHGIHRLFYRSVNTAAAASDSC